MLLERATLPDGSPAFDARELSHMEDVRSVFGAALRAQLVALVVVAVLALGLAWTGLRAVVPRGLFIGAVATLPVLRPLVGMDKGEIAAEAERIGTFETSIIPDQDCCQLFTPRHPATRAQPAEVAAAERLLDVPSLVALAVAGAERVHAEFPAAAAPPHAIARSDAVSTR